MRKGTFLPSYGNFADEKNFTLDLRLPGREKRRKKRDKRDKEINAFIQTEEFKSYMSAWTQTHRGRPNTFRIAKSLLKKKKFMDRAFPVAKSASEEPRLQVIAAEAIANAMMKPGKISKGKALAIGKSAIAKTKKREAIQKKSVVDIEGLTSEDQNIISRLHKREKQLKNSLAKLVIKGKIWSGIGKTKGSRNVNLTGEIKHYMVTGEIQHVFSMVPRMKRGTYFNADGPEAIKKLAITYIEVACQLWLLLCSFRYYPD